MNNLVSVVIPTRNEEENVKQLMFGIATALEGNNIKCERIVVDDSSDKTAEIAEQYGARVIKGKGQGLGQAIIDGIKASLGNIVVVMDSDFSHRPQDIPRLLKPILVEGADMTIGSRYVRGGSNPNWSLKRRIISRVACLLGQPIVGVKDATSGFFAFRKEILEV